MRVVTSNLHAGVDGWGRPTAALETALSLAPQILICPEVWRGDDGDDFVARIADSGLRGHFVPLARAQRVANMSPPATSRRWQPWSAHLTGERGLYYGEFRTFTRAQKKTRARQRFAEGTWGLGLFTSFELRDVRVEPLGRLPRERVSRAAVVATVVVDGVDVSVVAVHGAHLSHGSPLWFARLRRVLATLPDQPTIVAGDFNAWSPVVRILLPGWTLQGRGRTWPRPRPHSQIDHILTRGSWHRLATGTRDGGSDHLALYADIELVSDSSR